MIIEYDDLLNFGLKDNCVIYFKGVPIDQSQSSLVSIGKHGFIEFADLNVTTSLVFESVQTITLRGSVKLFIKNVSKINKEAIKAKGLAVKEYKCNGSYINQLWVI